MNLSGQEYYLARKEMGYDLCPKCKEETLACNIKDGMCYMCRHLASGKYAICLKCGGLRNLPYKVCMDCATGYRRSKIS